MGDGPMGDGAPAAAPATHLIRPLLPPLQLLELAAEFRRLAGCASMLGSRSAFLEMALRYTALAAGLNAHGGGVGRSLSLWAICSDDRAAATTGTPTNRSAPNTSVAAGIGQLPVTTEKLKAAGAAVNSAVADITVRELALPVAS